MDRFLQDGFRFRNGRLDMTTPEAEEDEFNTEIDEGDFEELPL